MKNFQVKLSYFPSRRYLENGFAHWALLKIMMAIFIAHGGCQWIITCGFKTLLASFLNLGAGYGVNNFPYRL